METVLVGGRYRLVERLGAGGMSVVWLGYDEVLGRQVAVKVLNSRLATDRALRRRIRIEAQAAARLVHPHITNVYDYGEWLMPDGAVVPYVIMELVDGESLADRLDRDNVLPWREALAMCAEVASALATAHSRGVVHRDVTPGNIMLTEAGAKVVDFGISALVGERDAMPDGSLLGTPAYVAPERLQYGQVSPATDVYALGVLLFRCLAGRLPWRTSTTTEVLRAHLYTDPDPLPPSDDVSEDIADLCRRCLAKAPTDRPSSYQLAVELAATAGVAMIAPISPAPVTVGTGGAGSGAVTAADVGAAGTTILPSSVATGALPVSDAPRFASASAAVSNSASRSASPATETTGAPRQRHGIGMVAAAAAGLIATTGLVWAATARTSANALNHQPTGAPSGAAASEPATTCQVRYALNRDSDSTFDAALTVTNSGSRPLQGWRLTFAFPGDQMLARGEGGVWEQVGRDVSVRTPSDGTVLDVGGSATLTATGSYRGGNPLPVAFELDGQRCDVEVSGAPGATGSPAAPSAPATAGQHQAGNAETGSGGAGSEHSGPGPGKPDEPKPPKGKGKGPKDH